MMAGLGHGDDPREDAAMKTPSLPNYKAPPKSYQVKAKAMREKRKACHGTWYPCDSRCGR